MGVFESTLSLKLLYLIGFVLNSSLASGNVFHVGERDGWTLSPSESYSYWAQRNRFQINDELVFKYPKGNDSVLIVGEDDYNKCNKRNPIQTLNDGNSIFKLDQSGLFFFISGHDQRCEKGQKIIIRVLADRHHHHPPPAFGPPPSHAEKTPFAPPLQPPSLSPSRATNKPALPLPHSLSPSSVAKTLIHEPSSHSPTPTHATPSNSPSPSPTSPTPSHAPSSHSPTPTHATPSQFPSPSPSSPDPTHAPSSHSPSPSPSSPNPIHAPSSHSPSPTHTPSSHSPSPSPSFLTPTHAPLSHSPSPSPPTQTHAPSSHSPTPANNKPTPPPSPSQQPSRSPPSPPHPAPISPQSPPPEAESPEDHIVSVFLPPHLAPAPSPASGASFNLAVGLSVVAIIISAWIDHILITFFNIH